MSLFQCQVCGCMDNTALSCGSGQSRYLVDCFDWTGIEDRKGKNLCSACAPSKYSGGEGPTKWGKWHGQFERLFLPKGQFRTNGEGNLEHIETKSTDLNHYAIKEKDNEKSE